MTPREDMGVDEAILDELPHFPLEALPPVAARYATEAARSIGEDMPVDPVALPMLAAFGGLIGNRLGIQPKRNWVERGALHVGIIAESGTAKTACMKAAARPVSYIQEKSDDQFNKALAAREEVEANYKRLKALSKEDKDSLPPPPSLLSESPKQRRRIVTTNTTFEATTNNLQYTPGMVHLYDEMTQWVGGMDAYRGGRGGDRAQWLSMWSNANIFTDRKTDNYSAAIYSPVVSVITGIQPSMLPMVHADPSLVDGFMERILFTAHRLQVPLWCDEEVSRETEKDIFEIAEALDDLPYAAMNPGQPIGIMTGLTRDAGVLFKSWYDEVAEIARAEPADTMRSYYSKLRNECLRIILINHALWTAERDPTTRVDSAAVEQGIAVASYLEKHYRAFVGETERQRELRTNRPIRRTRGPDGAPVNVRILEKLDGAGGRITRSNLIGRLGKVKAADLDAALDVLIADGTIREEHHGEGRSATRIYARVREPGRA